MDAHNGERAYFNCILPFGKHYSPVFVPWCTVSVSAVPFVTCFGAFGSNVKLLHGTRFLFQALRGQNESQERKCKWVIQALVCTVLSLLPTARFTMA